MIAKTLIAAAAVVSSLVAVAPEQAKAGSDLHIGVNLGVGHPGYYPGPGYGWGPAYPVYSPSTISCHQGKQSVRWSGFKMVTADRLLSPDVPLQSRQGRQPLPGVGECLLRQHCQGEAFLVLPLEAFCLGGPARPPGAFRPTPAAAEHERRMNRLLPICSG